MSDIKKIEFKSICVFSVFKYFGGMFLVIGLITGLFANILKINVAAFTSLRALPFMANITPGIPAGIAFAIVYGVSAGIGFSIFALIYNLFAGIVGGIKYYVKEE